MPTTVPTPPARLCASGSTVLLAYFGNHTQALTDRVVALFAQTPRERLGVLLYLGENAKAPSSTSRDTFARLMRAQAADAVGVACVIAGQGMVTRVQRRAMKGMHVLSGAKIPFETFSDPASALLWLRERGADVDDLEVIRQQMAEALAEFGTPHHAAP